MLPPALNLQVNQSKRAGNLLFPFGTSDSHAGSRKALSVRYFRSTAADCELVTATQDQILHLLIPWKRTQFNFGAIMKRDHHVTPQACKLCSKSRVCMTVLRMHATIRHQHASGQRAVVHTSGLTHAATNTNHVFHFLIRRIQLLICRRRVRWRLVAGTVLAANQNRGVSPSCGLSTSCPHTHSSRVQS